MAMHMHACMSFRLVVRFYDACVTDDDQDYILLRLLHTFVKSMHREPLQESLAVAASRVSLVTPHHTYGN